MKRLLSLVMAAAFAASLGTSAFADTMKGDSMKSSMPMKMKCPKGKTYVNSYKKKDGKMTKGYCRKS